MADLPTIPQVEAALCKKSLYHFFLRAWKHIDPDPLVDNWHIKVVCDALQNCLLGEGNPDLLINVPPGTAKSMIVSVMAPAWMWTFDPSWSAVYASGNPHIAVRDSVKTRNLLRSDWYQQTFKPKWQFADSEDQKTYFANTAGGFRRAIGAGASVTGDRSRTLFVDDPIDASDAYSEIVKTNINQWWDETFGNRVKDWNRYQRVVIMQRLAVDDLSGHILNTSKFDHLCLPMLFERQRADKRDLRKKEGEVLFPARFPEEVLADEKGKGDLYWAGQYQQLPFPLSGNMFKNDWWRFWKPAGGPETNWRPRGCSKDPAVLLPEDFDEIATSWDANFKKTVGKKKRDFVAGGLWGRKGSNKYLLRRFHERTGFIGALEAVLAFSEIRVGKRKRRASVHYVEDKANGSAIIETLGNKISGIVPVEPRDYGDKQSRAAATSPQVRAGNVYLEDGAPYLSDYISSHAAFPNGANDDEVDQTSQVLLKFAESETSFAKRFSAAVKRGDIKIDPDGFSVDSLI